MAIEQNKKQPKLNTDKNSTKKIAKIKSLEIKNQQTNKLTMQTSTFKVNWASRLLGRKWDLRLHLKEQPAFLVNSTTTVGLSVVHA